MIFYQGSEEKIGKMQRKDLKAKNELHKMFYLLVWAENKFKIT
jgi:hypothetical protein